MMMYTLEHMQNNFATKLQEESNLTLSNETIEQLLKIMNYSERTPITALRTKLSSIKPG